MPRCLSCNGPLVPFGNFRRNGSTQKDWVGREYHKKCWKTLEHSLTYFRVPYEKKDEAKRCGARWDSDIKLWYSPNDAVEMNMLDAHFKSVNLFKE